MPQGPLFGASRLPDPESLHSIKYLSPSWEKPSGHSGSTLGKNRAWGRCCGIAKSPPVTLAAPEGAGSSRTCITSSPAPCQGTWQSSRRRPTCSSPRIHGRDPSRVWAPDFNTAQPQLLAGSQGWPGLLGRTRQDTERLTGEQVWRRQQQLGRWAGAAEHAQVPIWTSREATMTCDFRDRPHEAESAEASSAVSK